MLGKYKLDQSQGAPGDKRLFASVELVVSEGSGLVIDFDSIHGRYWRAGATFGITYAWEKLPNNMRGMVVQVNMIKGVVVDTTEMAVAFASFRAMANAFGVEPKYPLIEFGRILWM